MMSGPSGIGWQTTALNCQASPARPKGGRARKNSAERRIGELMAAVPAAEFEQKLPTFGERVEQEGERVTVDPQHRVKWNRWAGGTKFDDFRRRALTEAKRLGRGEVHFQIGERGQAA